MDKKFAYLVLVFAMVLMIASSGCTQTPGSGANMTQNNPNGNQNTGTGGSSNAGSNAGAGAQTTSGLSERDRFIKANADLTCYIMGPDEDAFTNNAAQEAKVAVYGFTLNSIEAMTSKYNDDATKAAVVAEMMNVCPEVVEAINQMAQESSGG